MPGRRYATPRNTDAHGVVDSGLSVDSGPRRRSVQIVLSEIKRVWPGRPPSPHPPKAKKRRSSKRVKTGKPTVSSAAVGRKVSTPVKARRASKSGPSLAPNQQTSQSFKGPRVVRVFSTQKLTDKESRKAGPPATAIKKKTAGLGPGALELAFNRAQGSTEPQGDVADAYESERRSLDATREHWRLRDYGQFGSSPSYDDYDE